MVKQCTRCLYTENHPLGITFDDSGVCSGCLIHEEKDTLDWQGRWTELEELVASYKTKNSNNYDCIVPVSGAKDSFFVLHTVVNKLKLKPLVVSYNKLFNTPVGIANLARLRIAFNVDFHLKTVDPRIVKRITRRSIYAHGNPYWHCLAGETVFPVQVAVLMRIPLIIWGAHQGLEQVGMFSHLHNVEMSRRFRKDHDLFGVEANDLISDFDNLSDDDMLNYQYPAFSDIEEIGVRGVYLGNYVRWDPYAQHVKMVEDFGYQGMTLSRTFDEYDHADCFVYSNLHDLLKLYKHGYSKVTDQVCREIRFGRLTRQQGQELVRAYEMKEPDNMALFCEWLGVDQRSLLFAMNRHRNRSLWRESAPDQWEKKDFGMAPKKDLRLNVPLRYSGNFGTEKSCSDKFITIGKGVDWPAIEDRKVDEQLSWL